MVPLAPLEAIPKFMVPEVKRTTCWNRLCTRFIFPEGTDDLAKGYVMKQLAISFQGYRHDMNK